MLIIIIIIIIIISVVVIIIIIELLIRNTVEGKLHYAQLHANLSTRKDVD